MNNIRIYLGKIKIILIVVLLAVLAIIFSIFFYTLNFHDKNLTDVNKETVASKSLKSIGSNWEEDLFKNSSGAFNNKSVKKTTEPVTDPEQQKTSSLPTFSGNDNLNNLNVPTSLIQTDTGLSDEIIQKKKFGNEIGDIILKYGINGEKQEEVFRKAATSTAPLDSQTVFELNSFANNYKNLASSLSVVKAPSGAEKILNELSSRYSNLSLAISAVISGIKDSKIPIEKWVDYANSAQKLNTAYSAVMEYFKNNKIFFDSKENGFIFMYAL